MPGPTTRWAAWLAVQGDARFLSHHDVMRLVERAAARARLPVKFSHGFNPRLRFSLPLPRPVGVASACDLVVMDVDRPPTDAERQDFARQFPPGMTVLRDQALAPGRPPTIVWAAYAIDLAADEPAAVTARIRELADRPAWEVARPARDDSPSAPAVDIRPSVHDLAVDARRVSFQIRPAPAGTARPADVLVLLGLADPADAESMGLALARLPRTAVEYGF